MAYNFLVVDDERLSRTYIHDQIAEFVPDAVIRVASSGEEAIQVLEQNNTDVLFLDIRMADMDGFTMLSQVSHRNFELVFVTAYNEHAIRAIKEGAIDYLLKPVKKSDFKETITRIIERRGRNLELQKNTVSREEFLVQKLSLTHQQGLRIVMLKDIIYLKADNSYTTLIMEDGQKITTSKPIMRFEHALPVPWFFRIHKSFIINVSHLKEYTSKDGDMAVMSNGDKLYISRYRLTQFLGLIKEVSGGLQL